MLSHPRGSNWEVKEWRFPQDTHSPGHQGATAPPRYGRNCAPSDPYIEALTPSMTIVGHWMLEEIIKVKWGSAGWSPNPFRLMSSEEEETPVMHTQRTQQETAISKSETSLRRKICRHLDAGLSASTAVRNQHGVICNGSLSRPRHPLCYPHSPSLGLCCRVFAHAPSRLTHSPSGSRRNLICDPGDKYFEQQ